MLDITKDELLELAAQKLIGQMDLEEVLETEVQKQVRDFISSNMAANIEKRVAEFLNEELLKLLREEIVPVDIYGERAGKPTTLREIVKDRAIKFWGERVNENGELCSYGGVERHKMLYLQTINGAFEQAIKDNVQEIVTGFKINMKKHFAELTEKHIEDMIKR